MKTGIIMESTLRGRFDGRCSFTDHSGCAKQSFLPDIGMDSLPGLGFEQAHKMIPTQSHPLSKHVDRKIEAKILTDKRERASDFWINEVCFF